MIAPKMKKPDPIDTYVGKRLKQRRNLIGLSQEKLSDQLGITFQQVQKYENGSNRVGASRLFQIGRVLGVPVSFFFEDYKPASITKTLQAAEETAKIKDDVMTQKETLDLVRAYYAIPNAKVRKKMLDMLKSLSDSNKNKP